MDGDDAGRHRTPEPPVVEQEPENGRRGRRTALVVAGSVLGVLLVAYVADLLLTRGDVPRGTVVAGVAVGGLDPAAAEATLRRELEPRTTRPVELRAGDVTTTLDPTAAGLAVDWPATLARAGDQPLNPLARLTSFVRERTVEVVPTQDRRQLAAALDALRPTSDRAPVEGGIRFDGATPVPVDPVAGQTLQQDAAVDVVASRWLDGGPLEVPVDTTPVTVTLEGLATALDTVARPAASTDLVVPGRGRDAVLAAADVGRVLRFEPDGAGGLRALVDRDAATGLLAPQLAPTETAPRDADVVISGGSPTVVPGADGQRVDWGATLAGLDTLLAAPAPHVVPAAYVVAPPALTTEAATRLGIREVIGEFTTGGFSAASGVNIRLAASEIDGALVRPGDTFSLNGYTGPRGAAQGYVDSGIINNGRPDTAIGGGISQLATTLYNASYFAGMEDVTHQAHSYYISRYPAGREATVFEGVIDVAFRNPAQTGVLIETIGTGSDITVRLWGTKTVEVESVNGGRFDATSPSTVRLPAGNDCISSAGAPGFTTTDTRIIRAAGTGAELSRRTTTTVYDPVPRVICE
ncbi:VanW family protein [Rhodococcus aerolatus]